jgi:ABC-2 type transport system ATP-binding protein
MADTTTMAGCSDSPLVISGLRKVYGSFVAVDNLDLAVKRNSFTGLLGPNGAGKSTTLKMVTSLIRPTSGQILINGNDVVRDPKKALTGVGTVVETPDFYSYLTPVETFRYIGQLLGMTSESVSAQTSALLAKVKMTDWADKKLGTFSKGMRQRISLALALLDDPSVIILDEPTSGLDPRGMAEMREILKNIRRDANGLTVLMSSHMMYEVTDLCDRIAMMNHGKLLIHNDIENVIGGKEGLHHLNIKLVDGPSQAAVEAIGTLDHVESAVIDGAEIVVTFAGERHEEASFFTKLAALNIGVYAVAEDEHALENRYLEMIKESR